MKSFRLIITLAIIAVFSPPLFASWSEPMRLTYRGNEIDPQMVVRNDTVHVMWSQTLTTGQISYMRSTDNGETWGNIINLPQSGHVGHYPSMAITDSAIWICWLDNNLESFAITSTVNGENWTPPIYKYTIDSQRWSCNRMTAIGDTVFLIYLADTRDSTGLRPFKFLRSPDGGHTWSNLMTFAHLQENAGLSRLTFSSCGGCLFFVLDPNIDSLSGGYHITGYTSYDKGNHWSVPLLISPAQQAWAILPCLSCNQETGQFAVGYMDYRYQQYAFYGDIFTRLLESDPYQLGYESQVTNEHKARYPSISFQGDQLIVVWSDGKYFSTGDDEIFFNSSSNGGITWNGVQRLTETPGTSANPWVFIDSNFYHVVWWEYDYVDHTSDIYYMKYTPDSSDIINTDTPIPTTFKISAYPNPFNSTLSINITADQPGILNISDILGRFVTELNFPKGASTLKWDATDKDGKIIRSGAYFLKPKGGSSKDIVKVMYLK
jgi:hypothetical protein